MTTSRPRRQAEKPRTTLRLLRFIPVLLSTWFGSTCTADEAQRVLSGEERRASAGATDARFEENLPTLVPPAEGSSSSPDVETARRIFERDAGYLLAAVQAELEAARAVLEGRPRAGPLRANWRRLEQRCAALADRIAALRRIPDESFEDERRNLRDALERLDDDAERLLDQARAAAR